jgi:hypothetical protein
MRRSRMHAIRGRSASSTVGATSSFWAKITTILVIRNFTIPPRSNLFTRRFRFVFRIVSRPENVLAFLGTSLILTAEDVGVCVEIGGNTSSGRSFISWMRVCIASYNGLSARLEAAASRCWHCRIGGHWVRFQFAAWTGCNRRLVF